MRRHRDARHRHKTGTRTAAAFFGDLTARHMTKAPAFDKILPREMQKLVERGLFERDDNGGYIITAQGRAYLRRLELKEKEK